MGVSKNNGTPKMDDLQWKTLLKWMIWGAHPNFWKHPYTLPETNIAPENRSPLQKGDSGFGNHHF